MVSMDNNVQFEPLAVDIKTASKMLNVSERTVRTLTRNGELPVVKIMTRVLYSREDLIEFVRQRSKTEPCGGIEDSSQ